MKAIAPRQNMRTQYSGSSSIPLRSRIGSSVHRASLLLTLGIAMSLIANVVAAKDDEIILRLGKIERTLENRGLLDLLQRVESLQAEVQALRGQLEEQQYTIKRLRQSQREAYVDLDRRMQESLVNQSSTGEPNMGPIMDPNIGPNIGPNIVREPPLTVYQPDESPDVAGTPAPDIAVRTQQSPSYRQPDIQGAPSSQGPQDSPLGMEANRIARANQVGDVPRGAGEATGLASQGTDQSLGTGDPLLGDQVPAATASPTPETADQAYREAFGLLKAGKYDESIEAFNLFLLDHPNSEYADNAQYWLGETYFVKQEYTAAIDEYRKLITNFPTSKKQSHALLKIGYSYQRLGDLDNAQSVLKDLQTRYPGTTAARLAAERIQQILAVSP